MEFQILLAVELGVQARVCQEFKRFYIPETDDYFSLSIDRQGKTVFFTF